jgi:hypothetical protein
MPRRYSITSIHYTIPDFEGLSIRERINLIETLLPFPTTTDQAVRRATTGLYAIGKASCAIHEQLMEQLEYTGKAPFQFWSEVAADTESRFQGNINSVIAHKRFHQLDLAAPRHAN